MKKPIVLLTLISSLLLAGCGSGQNVDPIDDDTIIDIPDEEEGEERGIECCAEDHCCTSCGG